MKKLLSQMNNCSNNNAGFSDAKMNKDIVMRHDSEKRNLDDKKCGTIVSDDGDETDTCSNATIEVHKTC
jgi:hypothetical protein